MASWKKVIVSGSSAILNQVTASGGFSGDGSGITGISGLTDNNFTNTLLNKLNAIEASADVTDATNVTAAGALMDSEVAALTLIKGLTAATISGSVVGQLPTVGAGGLTQQNFTTTLKNKLDAIEASADVTDATNVTAAGALMDSEVAQLTLIKGLTQATISGSVVGQLPTVGDGGLTQNNFTNADHSKLNDIEASATADQSNAEIRTAVEAATDSNVFTDADHTKLNAIEASADVTDATNVTAAGALMDSEVAQLTLIKGLTQATISGSVVGQLPTVGDGGLTTNNFTNADHSKLNAIEASADVTDATNVTAAGALMDSELTNLAAVKAINQSLVSGATPTFTATNFTDASNKRFMSNAQETKLDSVESSADVTDTTNVTAAGALMDSELSNLAAVKAINQGLATGNDVAFNKLTLAGDLIVNGTTTTLSTTNLSIEDKFITIASGSTSATDGGLVVSKQANGAGFGFGYDTATTRWGFQDGLAVDATGIVPDAFVGTVEVHGTAAPSDAPVYGGETNGYGTIHVKKNTGDIYIYA